jgi:DNA-binding response OmpR family regulator
MITKNVLQIGGLTGTPSQRYQNHQQRILVAEDMEGLRHLNIAVLSGSGYQVEAVADGAIAWDTLQENSYDLLITDHQMPELTGVELLKKLRAARMALPVIMVSGTMPVRELSLHPWLQVDAMLAKPYTPHDLVDTVRKVLHVADSIPEQLTPPKWHNQFEAGYSRPYSLSQPMVA